jgi:hypothetical protein
MKDRYEEFIHEDDEAVHYWRYNEGKQSLEAVKLGTWDGRERRKTIVGEITLWQIQNELPKHVALYKDLAWWDRNNFIGAMMKGGLLK